MDFVIYFKLFILFSSTSNFAVLLSSKLPTNHNDLNFFFIKKEINNKNKLDALPCFRVLIKHMLNFSCLLLKLIFKLFEKTNPTI